MSPVLLLAFVASCALAGICVLTMCVVYLVLTQERHD